MESWTRAGKMAKKSKKTGIFPGPVCAYMIKTVLAETLMVKILGNGDVLSETRSNF